MIRDRLPQEYRSLVKEPVLGFRHDALARGLAELSKELSIQDSVSADGRWMLQALAHMMRVTTNARDRTRNCQGASLPHWAAPIRGPRSRVALLARYNQKGANFLQQAPPFGLPK
jgi:hypothetical protein